MSISQGVGTVRGEVVRGGVAGYGIDDKIVEAYTWLIQNFDDGDEIFIFGFSSGAYTARSLSGLISKCGILKLEHFPIQRNRRVSLRGQIVIHPRGW